MTGREQSRRAFLKSGSGALAAALAAGGLVPPALARRALGVDPPSEGPCLTGALPLEPTRPLAPAPLHPNPRVIDGFRFAPWFTGDDYTEGHFPFHSDEREYLRRMGIRPRPTETVRVAVIGGGISGLTTAYLLRRFDPVVFEMRDRFGGSAQGEVWEGAPYSLGGAYVITPDPGSDLHTLYHHLRLHQHVRVDSGATSIELNSTIIDDLASGAGFTLEELPALQAYLDLVDRMANQTYPDVPFATPWEQALDQITFKDHIEQEMGLPVPRVLEAAIQAYCYSSFCGGWEELSAASGWNFLAAEEFGRWVFPGGNAFMADRAWEELSRLDAGTAPGCQARHLRGGCRVVEVRPDTGGMTRVTYRDSDGRYRALLAERVVMANSKRVGVKMLEGLDERDPAKRIAMDRLNYNAYMMANVLLDREIPHEFYDIFLLGDGEFPTNPNEARNHFKATDVLDGSFTSSPYPGAGSKNVLSYYWPMSYPSARFDIIFDDPILRFAKAFAAQLRETLPLLGLDESGVREIRFTRWGHALPLSEPGFIAEGNPQELIRPYEGRVYFVNQDNWALPAVENCVYDAHWAADQIASAL